MITAGSKINAIALQAELTQALICDRFDKLPSEVRREDYATLMRTWTLLGEVDKFRK